MSTLVRVAASSSGTRCPLPQGCGSTQRFGVKSGHVASLVKDEGLPGVATLWSGSQAREEVLDDLVGEPGIQGRGSQQPAVE
jgi:hypothetical protein